jgi:hypothetical protein
VIRDNNAGTCTSPAGKGAPGAGIDTLSTDGTWIYGGGWSFNCGNFEGTFKVNPTSGAINWLNDCHGDTYSAVPIGGVLYSVSHAHDCSIVGSFTQAKVMSTSPPPGYWLRALAEATTPVKSGKNGTDPRATTKGFDKTWSLLKGQPDTTVLDWVPNLSAAQPTTAGAPPGTLAVTGWSQAAESITGNTNYVAIAGEMPFVDGVAQQGLTRYAVHSIAPDAVGPEPTSVLSPTATAAKTAGTVKLSWRTAWDRDNQTLTYRVYRDGASTPIHITTASSTFWTLPSLAFTDTGLAGGPHSYVVRISDPDGNTVATPAAYVTLPGGTKAPPSDLALNQPAADSSNYGTSTAARAVDGITDGVWADNSVTLTLADHNAWWQVDLGAAKAVNEIDVYNRTDGSYSVMSDYWVFVSSKPFDTALTPAQQATTAGVLFAGHQTSAPSPETALTGLAIAGGRYVMIQQNAQQSIQLAEVIVK